jgi:hypothetical protein
MSRVRTLWGVIALLMVIGLVAPAFAQDTATNSATADQNQDNLLAPVAPAPSPTMALEGEEAAKKKAWYEMLSLKGSFRFRNQVDYSEGRAGTNPVTNVKNYRFRYRLLLDLGGDFDNFKLGIQLGSAGSSTSANETYGDPTAGDGNNTTAGFAAGALYIRKAYATVNVAEMLDITFGRMGFPKTMYRDILTWDSDVNPTGITLAIKPLEDGGDTHLYVNTVMWMALDDDNSGTWDDSLVFAFTVLFETKMGESMKLQAGGGIWVGTNPHNLNGFSAGDLAESAFAGARDDMDFACFEFNAKLSMDALTVFAHIIYNAGGFRGFGGLGGVSFWTAKKGTEGAFGIDLIYYYCQTGAFPTINDADSGNTGRMNGYTGIEFNAQFYITSNVALGIETNFFYFMENTRAVGDDHDGGCVLIFDAYFYF